MSACVQRRHAKGDPPWEVSFLEGVAIGALEDAGAHIGCAGCCGAQLTSGHATTLRMMDTSWCCWYRTWAQGRGGRGGGGCRQEERAEHRPSLLARRQFKRARMQ